MKPFKEKIVEQVSSQIQRVFDHNLSLHNQIARESLNKTLEEMLDLYAHKCHENTGMTPFTLQETMEERFDKLREEKWRYLDVGNEYTPLIKSFIKSEIEKARKETLHSCAKIAEEDITNAEKRTRQGTLREVREKLKEKYYNNAVLNDDQIGDLLSTLESKE